MFNMMSVDVAEKVAEYCGLRKHLRDLLVKPITHAAFAWRLPHNGVPIQHLNERGLPQGLAGSVLMAELNIAPALWKIQRALGHDDNLSIVAYVDDMNIIIGSEHAHHRVLQLLREHEASFQLKLSRTKTKVWSTKNNEDEAAPFPSTRILKAPGAEWPIDKRAAPDFKKKSARIEEVERRFLGESYESTHGTCGNSDEV